ncbi:MAG: penicillin acylase family protein [Chitinophagaceae bacterium]
MRLLSLLISLLITIVLIIALDTRWILPAPLGRLLSPQHGVWQNAEPTDATFNETLHFPGLTGNAEVFIDERLVPHVFAENDADVFFVQGFLHAKFRLWQMEFQTHAAGGRLTEVLGEKLGTTDILNKADRYFRRLGMTYAAEGSLKLMEQDPGTRLMSDAYTHGINAYIQTLTQSTLPLEYKILGYSPEPWTNLKTALFLKYMSFDLAGYETDFEYTSARNAFTKAVFDKMYPLAPDSADPIVPLGTLFDKPGILPKAPASRDSLYMKFRSASSVLPIEPQKPDKENGSNNWAVSGSKTKSRSPILCNDPHLGLNLPSLWFEMQLHTPNFNVYGASFPCGPGVVIGFNDSCAFGFTNAGRDVRDYYEIVFKDATRQQYLLNGKYENTIFRIERYKIKGKRDFIDTVAYTVFGPVIFDEKFAGKSNDRKSYAVRWKAHDPSNELKAIYELDRCKNYIEYVRAARNFHTPGQNIVFAAKNGDIAIRAQGEFPAKWARQGDFVMPGTDSSYLWQGMIPQAENPRQYNPERGFVSSANQFPADTSYPYYLGNAYPPYRGLIINRRLSQMENITPQDMMKLQTDNYNVFAEFARPLLLKAVSGDDLPADAKKYWEMLKTWNLRYDGAEKGATVFAVLFDSLENVIWRDELAPLKNYLMPAENTLLEGLLRDSAYQFLDDVTTPQKETLHDNIIAAFRQALPVLKKAEDENRLHWAAFKDTRVTHLTRLMQFSRLHLNMGGGRNAINATKTTHGPSWRMVVHLTPETEAYGVYPGGQHGNPGSKYYDNFIDTWAKGEYYPLVVMKKNQDDSQVKWTMKFLKSETSKD